MGLMLRRRRPVMRLAGATALGTIAAQSGELSSFRQHRDELEQLDRLPTE